MIGLNSIPLFTRLVVSLTALFIVTLVLIVGVPKLFLSTSMCLANPAYRFAQTLIDPRTGVSLTYPSHQIFGNEQRSPDGTYTSGILATLSNQPRKVEIDHIAIILRRLDNQTLVQLHEAKTSQSVSPNTHIEWSPDGQKLMYMWSGSDSKYGAEIYSIEAHNSQQVFPLGNKSYPILNFHGWSADSKYTAYFFHDLQMNSAQSGLRLWTSSDGQGIDLLSGYNLSASGFSAWSNQGHRLAFVTADRKASWLFIVSPENGIDRVLKLPSNTHFVDESRIIWSPDDQYVAFNYWSPADNKSHVAVFDVVREIYFPEAVDQQTTVWMPDVYWSPEGLICPQ